MWFAVAACTQQPSSVDSGTDLPDLPGHNDCLPEGEVMPDDTCLDVVEVDGRMPTVSYLSSDAPPAAPDDPRLTDPDYVWLTDQIRRCTCSCCHQRTIGGPGVHRWDLDFEPVWIDSANDWVLQVFVGETEEYLQTFPTDDPERVRAVVEREWARREAYER
ncbi:MAG: hypothetical protein ABMA64_31200 [Myxococcota bacterium]